MNGGQCVALGVFVGNLVAMILASDGRLPLTREEATTCVYACGAWCLAAIAYLARSV